MAEKRYSFRKINVRLWLHVVAALPCRNGTDFVVTFTTNAPIRYTTVRAQNRPLAFLICYVYAHIIRSLVKSICAFVIILTQYFLVGIPRLLSISRRPQRLGYIARCPAMEALYSCNNGDNALWGRYSRAQLTPNMMSRCLATWPL